MAQTGSCAIRGEFSALDQASGSLDMLDPSSAPQVARSEEEAGAIARAAAEGRVIVTDYPIRPRVRAFSESAGGRRIRALCDGADESVSGWLTTVRDHLPALRAISFSGDPEAPEPYWNNGMIPGLDGMLLYAMIRRLKPATYLEVGSGNSTKFVAKAIRDAGLSTRIISIDPYPRAVVDALCDDVVRQPFEDVPIDRYLPTLKEGDVVYIDNSHRAFQNSDVTVFFTELLPALPAGAYYGIHDIFLPADYPEQWLDRYYNEQYLLIAYLLGGADGDAVVFPGLHASVQRAGELADLFDAPEFEGVSRHAGAFWMRRGG
ncbi:hypothetical protein J2X36_001727 [Methylobacterium sp. BE186]|uniref:class I SAM-dependent methyltransferase n=1 Tax=Methylobacterium sp. BE186 TaxID=2817715 RepID=UPI00285D228C|nr:class I SAM-dependent methyltransferase [Methylobacterium sp. BE186]MDR7036983.1 hypothetical protein [Methylobacterium sp. BE186]